MRTRLWAFVTFLGLIGCGASTGGGGGGPLICGVGGGCPAGYTCNASNICVFGSDISVSDSGGKDASDATPGVDTKADSSPADSGPADSGPADTGPADTGPADTGTPDVQASTQTVSAIEQAATSANCTTLDSIADSASDVALEPVIVTSPPTSLKGSGTTYFTSFFVEAQNGAAADGSWAGIQVIVTASPFSVNVGDVLSIKGTVKEFYCMTEISAAPADVVVTGNDGTPTPHSLLVSLFANPTSPEPYEGDLVTISNVQVADANPVATDGKTHGEATINHNGGATTVIFAPAIGSAYLGTSANGATTTFSSGQAFASITGNLEWSFGQWLIRARSDADIVLK